MMTSGIEHLVKQAGWSRTLGSPLTADVIAILAETLTEETETGRRIRHWPGNADDDAVSMRIAGGIHALARRGTDPELTALYKGAGGDPSKIIPRIVSEHDDFLSKWLDRPPQTNEVARAGVLWPGMMEIARRFGSAMEWLELGSSAGLNLNMDRFAYDLGGVRAGDETSRVKIRPEWVGSPPACAAVNVVDRVGVDLDPVNLSDPAEVERLTSFVWVGMAERMARIEGAIAIAEEHPPRVQCGDLVEWLEARLRLPQKPGVTRVVFHSITFQYIPEAARSKVEELLHVAGQQATAERPLARLQMEMVEFGKPIHLSLQCWPGGGALETLAHVHPHGTKIGWLA